jgi:hypothetical protein
MDVEVFPLIAPNDYPALLALIGSDLPDTYDEWRNLQANEIRQFIQAGRTTKEVPVDLHQFSNFLQERGAKANLVSLRNCTIEIDAGHH